MSPDEPDEAPERETMPTFVDFDEFDAKASTSARPVLIQTAGLEAGRVFEVPEGASTLRRARGWELSFDGDGAEVASLLREADRVLCTTLDAATVGGEPAAARPLVPGDRLEAGPVLLRFQRVGPDEARALRELYAGSRRDGLTGLANARALVEHLSSEVAYARRHKEPLSLLIVDLDGSSARALADGFDALDPLVRLLGRVVGACVERGDVIARTGADELCVAQRGVTLERGATVGDQIRAALAAASPGGPTVSVGVASLACLGDDPSDSALLERARARVEAARLRGGDRVSTEG